VSELLNIPVGEIGLTDRARQEYHLDEDFLSSIREKGVIQPITVKRNIEGSDTRFSVLAGGRRYSAVKQLGIETIPCLVRDSEGTLDDREIEFLENAQRRDLTWQERLKLVNDINNLMAEKYGERGSQSKTAKFLDKSVGGITRAVQLGQLISKFPALGACTTEDEAVKRGRKILEAALVKTMAKTHRAESGEPDPSGSPSGETPERKHDDPYLRLARAAEKHYRIGSCFDGMQEMIDNGMSPPIILVEVDPPYGIDLQEQKKGDSSKELDIYEEIPRDQYEEWTYKLVDYLYKVTPPNTRVIYWYGHEWYDLVARALRETGFSIDPIPCIWNKGSGQTNDPDRYLARTYETFIVATKGTGTPIAKRGRSNVFTHAPVPHSKKYHPTQKPLALMEDILETFGWPGGIVLCPFLGSGVTLRACYNKGMLPFGWELNEENVDPFLAAVQGDIDAYTEALEKPQDSEVGEIPFNKE
jgi:ParB/RepB/Spo0J family partition protein